MKRIAFVISTQHLKPTGGIGTFAKSFTQLCYDHDIFVDIILDKAPIGTTKEFVLSFLMPFQSEMHYCKNPLPYENQQIVDSHLDGDGVNYPKIRNFQTIFIERSREVTYDAVIVNTQEAIAAIAVLKTQSPVYLYTHSYKQVFYESQMRDNCLPVYHQFYESFMFYDNVTVATQTDENKQILHKRGIKNVVTMPLPLAEKSLLETTDQNTQGVLFIGTAESRKRYQVFIDLIKQTNLPARVMTSKKAQKSFEQEFKKHNITDYVIKTAVTGIEKADFIKSCRVSFIPSKMESYCYAFIETIPHMPVVVLDDQPWTHNFDSELYVTTSKKDMASVILDCYNKEYNKSPALNYVKAINDNAEQTIRDIINK